jgi:glyoxylase-like metal-dependent hydrolase (beta-lactamase superfamily II)
LIKPFPKVENIHAVAIPFPNDSHLISANVYAIGNGPVTLIDTGPKVPGILSFLRKELQKNGIKLSDIERIIITHGHIDHFGLAVSIQKAVGYPVECFIHTEDSYKLSKKHIEEEMWNPETENFMARAGLPQKEIEAVRKRFAFFRTICDPLEKVSNIGDGDSFLVNGNHFEIIHTPGHTAGSCCIYESNSKVLFSGDNIIKHITPNPLVELKRSLLKDPTYQSLKAYLSSLEKLSQLDVRFVFTGHGDYIDDLQGIIKTYREHHLQRQELIRKALKKDPRPVYDLIHDVFAFVPESDMFLAVSDITGHLEILINEKRAELIETGPPALYRAV